VVALVVVAGEEQQDARHVAAVQVQQADGGHCLGLLPRPLAVSH
jgi:hypothetical protein